jgi:hypothetical protein
VYKETQQNVQWTKYSIHIFRKYFN